MSSYVNHACLDCGTVRSVRKIDLERGQREYCRKCKPKHTVSQRSKSLREIKTELEEPLTSIFNRVLSQKKMKVDKKTEQKTE